jgi:hypothetical protein
MAGGRHHGQLFRMVGGPSSQSKAAFHIPINTECFDRLDDGDGKELSLDECPRGQLEKEVVSSVMHWSLDAKL